MSLHGFLIFCAVYILAAGTPGPAIAALIARTLSKGPRGIGMFIAGLVVGDLIWFALTAAGLAALAKTTQMAFLAVRYGGALYLLYVAWKLWTAPAHAAHDRSTSSHERPSKVFMGTLALAMGNPKTAVFFLALLPAVVDPTRLTVPDFIQISVTMCVLLSLILAAYGLAALRARRLFESPKARRWLNRTTATVMAGAAVAVAAE